MAETRVGAAPGAWPEWQSDVALAFADAQRDCVSRFIAALTTRGVRMPPEHVLRDVNAAEAGNRAKLAAAAEQARELVAARGPRLGIAPESTGYGLTQTEAAPQLVAHWEDARTTSPYGWAVLTAALDVARLGARAPLSADLLCAAAPGYCTSQQQIGAPENWFEQALADAASKQFGTMAALSPAESSMGQVAGYIVADCLIQQAIRERRYAHVPTSIWEAVVVHLRDPADSVRLAESARNRLLYRYAIPLYHRASATGDGNAARQLADLLAERGDFDEAEQILCARVGAGDEEARRQLAGLLARHGDLNRLRARAHANDRHAAIQLARLLARRGDFDEAEQILCARVGAGDEEAGRQLAGLLAERGDFDEAEQILCARVGAGDEEAGRQLAGLLARHGDLDGLRARADAGDEDAAAQLADLLADSLARHGDLEGLRARADLGDRFAARRLADLLADRGDTAEAMQMLRAGADAGDNLAAARLANLLAGRGDLEGLRARADLGDRFAARRLADLLVECGDLDGLRGRAAAGDGRYATGRLTELLIKQGRGEDAKRLRRFGLNPDGSIASG